jgi:hypothetical protein
VEKDIPPAPTKSDLIELGDANQDGVNEHGGVALPEIACPLGVYFIFPPALDPGRRGGQETGFAPYDGTNQEPLDGRGVFVDMNGNGARDKRETLTQAWQRLGLLKSGQKFTRSAYTGCVKAAAAKLVKDGLLLKKVGEAYVEQAAKKSIANGGPTN